MRATATIPSRLTRGPPLPQRTRHHTRRARAGGSRRPRPAPSVVSQRTCRLPAVVLPGARARAPRCAGGGVQPATPPTARRGWPARPPTNARTTPQAPGLPIPVSRRHGRTVSLRASGEAGSWARRAASPAAIGARRTVGGAATRRTRRRRPGGTGDPSQRRNAASGAGHGVRRGTRSPCRLRRSWRRVVVLARACWRVSRSRGRWRCSSASTAGAVTTCPPCRAPCASRRHSRRHGRTATPALVARRRQRLTARAEASTTGVVRPWACTNRCRQQPARPAAAPRTPGAGSGRPTRRVAWAMSLSPGSGGRAVTVRARGLCPRPVGQPSFQVCSRRAKATHRTRAGVGSWPLWVAVVVRGFLLHGRALQAVLCLEKTLPNSGPLREPADKHSIYTLIVTIQHTTPQKCTNYL